MRNEITLWALLGVLVLAGPARADEPHVVAVEGQASVETAPDLAFLSMAVEARAPEVPAASASVAEGVARVLAFTRELGIPDEHVSTAAASVRPEFDWDKTGSRQAEGPRRVVIGYYVRRQITVRLEDVDRIGRLIEGVLAAGVNHLSDAVFDTTRRAELERQALGQAVEDARRRAEAIAAADGARVGKAQRLSAHHAIIPRGPAMMRSAEAMAVAPEQTYQTGDIVIEARVQAEFELLSP